MPRGILGAFAWDTPSGPVVSPSPCPSPVTRRHEGPSQGFPAGLS